MIGEEECCSKMQSVDGYFRQWTVTLERNLLPL